MNVPGDVITLLADHSVAPAAASLGVYPQDLSTAEEVNRVVAQEGAEGWVCYPGGAYDIRRLRDLDPAERRTGPLSAELFVNEESVIIRLTQQGWKMTRFREEQSEQAKEVLYFDQDYLSTERGQVQCYRIYWRRAADEFGRPWRPWVAAFRGWGKEDVQ